MPRSTRHKQAVRLSQAAGSLKQANKESSRQQSDDTFLQHTPTATNSQCLRPTRTPTMPILYPPTQLSAARTVAREAILHGGPLLRKELLRARQRHRAARAGQLHLHALEELA